MVDSMKNGLVIAIILYWVYFMAFFFNTYYIFGTVFVSYLYIIEILLIFSYI